MISIVVPIYNEEGNIKELYRQINEAMASTEESWSLILVDDGSRDGSFNAIRDLCHRYDNIKGIKFSRNFGQYAAVCAGIENAEGSAIIVMDADMQEPPSLIPKLIDRWKSGDAAVYTTAIKRDETWLRKAPALLFHKIFWNNINLGNNFSLRSINNVSEMRLLDRKIVDEFKKMKEAPRFLKGVFFWLGFKHSFVEYKKQKRSAGLSKYSIGRLFRLAMDGFFSFSNMPVRLIFVAGKIIFIVGLGLGIYLAISQNSFFGIPTSISFLFAAALCLFGLQFFFLGILGEYLGRIYDESRRRPKYIVEESIGK